MEKIRVHPAFLYNRRALGWALEGSFFGEVLFDLLEVHVSNVLTNSVSFLSHESNCIKVLLNSLCFCCHR
jgi:hypothetical protein